MSNFTVVRVKVPVQHIYMTRGALCDLHPDDVSEAVICHVIGDWGTVDEEDWKANDQALEDGGRILSTHVDRKGQRFWIITEADRSATTVLLPQEY